MPFELQRLLQLGQVMRSALLLAGFPADVLGLHITLNHVLRHDKQMPETES